MAENKNTDSANVNTTPVQPPKTRANAREDGGKQIGAWFNPAEVAEIREIRFVKRHDKDSDVIRAAVREYIDKHGEPVL